MKNKEKGKFYGNQYKKVRKNTLHTNNISRQNKYEWRKRIDIEVSREAIKNVGVGATKKEYKAEIGRLMAEKQKQAGLSEKRAMIEQQKEMKRLVVVMGLSLLAIALNEPYKYGTAIERAQSFLKQKDMIQELIERLRDTDDNIVL